ncbi:MAG: peptidase U32 family protein, partial [Fusobacteriaceae bacterium]
GDENSEKSSFIFNSKDLCTINIIDKLLEIGVDSLKIEGRMKGIYYVSNVVKVYRDAVDSYYRGDYKVNPQWIAELESTSNRSYSTGFLENVPGPEGMNYSDRNSYSQTHQLVAKVIEKLPENNYILEVRNRIVKGDKLQVINPTFGIKEITLPEIVLIVKGKEEISEFANPNSIVRVKLDENLDRLDMIRKVF